MPEPDATITITGMNEKIKDPRGKEVTILDAEGKEAPADTQMTLGNVLLMLVTRMKVPEKPRQIILAQRVLERIAEASDGEGEYTAGSAALGILREAAKQNGPGYLIPVMAQVWLAIGTGEPDEPTTP